MPSISSLKHSIKNSQVDPYLPSESQRERRKEAIRKYLKAINYGDNREYPKIRFYFGDSQTTVTTWAKDVFTAKVARELNYPHARKPTHIEKD